jgi:hypothetical protein
VIEAMERPSADLDDGAEPGEAPSPVVRLR